MPNDATRAPMNEVRQRLAAAIGALADEVEGLERSFGRRGGWGSSVSTWPHSTARSSS